MKFENQSDRTASVFLPCSADVAIHIKNGTAIITGTVCSAEDRLKTESAVKLMSGIDQVFNMVKEN